MAKIFTVPVFGFALFCILLTTACEKPIALGDAGMRHDLVSYRGLSFDVVSLNPTKVDLQLFWKDQSGAPYRNFESLKLDLQKQNKELVFATNAGIFSSNFSPGGLHVEKGTVASDLNLREGEGNFHLLPNGVFYLNREAKAGIIESHQYSKDQPQTTVATQSGPMLVINGELHPSFSPRSENLHVRSGVGVNNKGDVVFVISRNLVSFYNFARLFRDKLACGDALYLDGNISRIFLPEKGLTETSGDFVGILGVVKSNGEELPVQKESGSQPGAPTVTP